MKAIYRKNFISQMGLLIAVAIVNFWVRKTMVSSLGMDITGMYQIFVQFCGYLAVFEAGCGLAVAHELYELIENQKYSEASKIVNGARNVYKYIIITIGFLSVPGFFILVENIVFTNIEEGTLALSFALVILGFLIDYTYAAERVLIEVENKLYRFNNILILARVADTLISILMLDIGLGLPIVLTKTILINLLLKNKITRFVKINVKWYVKSAECQYAFAKKMRSLIVQGIASALIYNSSSFILGKYATLNDVVVFSTYMMLVNFGQSCVNAIPKAFATSFGRYINGGKFLGAKEIYWDITILTFGLATITSISIMLNMEWFVSSIFGSGFEINKMAVILFSMQLFLSGSRTAIGMVIIVKGEFAKTTKWAIIEGALMVAMAIPLVKNMGVSGFVMATVISIFVATYMPYTYIAVKNILNGSFVKYLITLAGLVAPLVFATILYVFVDLGSRPNYAMTLTVASIISTALYYTIFRLKRKDGYA